MIFNMKAKTLVIVLIIIFVTTLSSVVMAQYTPSTDFTSPTNLNVGQNNYTAPADQSFSAPVSDGNDFGSVSDTPGFGNVSDTPGFGNVSDTPGFGATNLNLVPTGTDLLGGGTTRTGSDIGRGSSGESATKVGRLQNPLAGVNSVGQLVGKAAEIFSYIVILFAVLVLVWTGLQYILARGNAEKMKELSNRLLWIVIGIAIVIGARIIVEIVINTVASTGVVKPEIIDQANRAIRNQ